jgi:hypothetical protein
VTVTGIYLARSGLVGTIPAAVGAWVDLVSFNIELNYNLRGSVPASVSQWKKVKSFTVFRNRLSGVLPELHWDWDPDCELLVGGGGEGFDNNFSCPWPKGATTSCTVLDGYSHYVTDAYCSGTHRCDASTHKCVYDPAGTQTAAQCSATCKAPTPPPTPTPTPPPTPTQSYKCTAGQCVATTGGISKAACESLCVEQLYQCVANKCTPASSGANQTTCEAVCGP